MRESQTKKIPITLILGDNEKDNETISYRLFGSRDTTTKTKQEFVDLLIKTIKDKDKNVG